jgi:glycosyltransferase involved in cell wall biosynthesis
MKTLSICIPAYNRADLLRSALYSLAPQINEFPGEVELIVADDCSPDTTEQVVRWAQQFCPIRYQKHDKNIGACKNLVYITTQLATGVFCWVLGDDDFVRPGAVRKVLDTIKKYPGINCIFINYASFSVKQLQEYPNPVRGADLPKELPLGNKDPGEYYVDRWETLIRPEISDVYLGGIQTSIIRRDIWREHANILNIGEPYTSLDATYPQAIIFTKGLVGTPAYYIGTPYIIVIDGAREWLENVPKICLVYLHELLDYYEQHGVNHNQLERCRKHLVKNNVGMIIKLVSERTAIKNISTGFLLKYLLKHGKYIGAIVVDKAGLWGKT